MSAAEHLQRCLRSSTLGDSLSEQQISTLAGSAKLSAYKSGSIVFAEGELADALRIVCSGRVALDMHVPVRGSIRIMTLGPQDILGWSALVGDGCMSTTAIVLGDADLLEIPAESLRTLCSEDAELGRAVMHRLAQALARRLRATRLQLLDLFSETEPGMSMTHS